MKQRKVFFRVLICLLIIGVFFICNQTSMIAMATYAKKFLTNKELTRIKPAFGRTHFIIGYPRTDIPSSGLRTSKLFTQLSSGLKVPGVLFSPKDKVQEILLDLISQERKHIAVAAYTLTDQNIADALCNAKERGIDVEVIIDQSALAERYNKILCLNEHAIPVFIYNPNMIKKGRQGIMHNKFMIFHCNIANKSFVWTGSYNFTKAGSQNNQENVVILDAQLFIKKFSLQFEHLKKQSYLLTKQQH